MAIKTHAETIRRRKREIDLGGEAGNAFCLLGLARDLCKQLHLDWNAVRDDMQSSDYEHLITVFDKHFGQIYDLIRPETQDPDEQS